MSEEKAKKQAVKKELRRKRKLLSHASSRAHAKLMCKGLPRSLVPTNMSENHGHDPKVLNETAVVMGKTCRRGFVKMMSTRADLRKFEIHKSLVDIHRDERFVFARKYSRWGNRICSCKHPDNCKVHSAAVLWVYDDLNTGGILRRTDKSHKFVHQDVQQPRLSFVHFLKWDSITRRPVLMSECQTNTCTIDVVSNSLSTRSTMLPAVMCYHAHTVVKRLWTRWKGTQSTWRDKGKAKPSQKISRKAKTSREDKTKGKTRAFVLRVPTLGSGQGQRAKRDRTQFNHTPYTQRFYPSIFIPISVTHSPFTKHYVFFLEKKGGKGGEGRRARGEEGDIVYILCVCARGGLNRLRRQGKALDPKVLAPATKIHTLCALLSFESTRTKQNV